MNERMREQKTGRPRVRLLRGADGRLRPASGGSDIGDIWAEQKRIRLREAIQEEQRKAEKKKRAGSAEIVVKIGFPKVKRPNLRPLVSKLKPRKKLLVVALSAIIISGLAYAAFWYFGGRDDNSPDKDVLSSSGLPRETPDFKSVLPEGKNIEDLGGWARVSPPDRDPVYAFVDNVGGTQLNVSQQVLPKSFEEDIAGEVAKLAEQFGATKRLAVDDLTIYIGTSSRGPQSVIFTRESLLILIRSSSQMTDNQWAAYARGLH